jgi:hypothetical protein
MESHLCSKILLVAAKEPAKQQRKNHNGINDIIDNCKGTNAISIYGINTVIERESMCDISAIGRT